MPQLAVTSVGKKADNTGSVIGGILGAIAAAAATFLTAGAAAPAAIAGEGAIVGGTVGAGAGAAAAGAGAGAAAAGAGAGAAAGAGVGSAAGVNVGAGIGGSVGSQIGSKSGGGAGSAFLDQTKTYIGSTQLGRNVGSEMGSVADKPGAAPQGPVVDTSAPERRLQQGGSGTSFDPMQTSSILQDSLHALKSAPPDIQQIYQPSLLKAYVHSMSQDYDRSNGGKV